MICKNCGSQFDDTLKVCPVCGKVVETTPEEQPLQPENSVHPKGRGPKKPITIKKIPLISGIAGVLAVIVVATVFLWDRIDNAFAKTFMSPEDYYAHVEKSNVENTVSMLYNFLGLGSSSKDLKDGFTGSMKVEIGDSMKEFYEIVGIEDQLDWLEEVEFSFDSDVTSELMQLELSGKLNSTNILSGELILDAEDGKVFATLPGILDKYIELPYDIEGMMGGSNGVVVNPDEMDIMGANTAFGAMTELREQIESAIPSEKVAAKLLVKYFEVIVDSLENVEKESNKLEIKDVSQSCTLITVKIDGETILNALTAVLKEAKGDKELKSIIEDMAEALDEDPDDVYDIFKEGVEDALDALEDIDEDDIDDVLGEKIVLKNWVSSEGVIVGRQIEIGEVRIMIASIEQGSKVATEYSVKVDSVKMLEFKGSGKKTLGGKITATYKLEVQEQELLEVDVKDYDSKAYEDDGYLNGEFYFSLGDDLLSSVGGSGMPEEFASIVENLRLGFVISSDDEHVSLATKIMNKGDSYITFTVSATLRDYKKPSVPSGSETVSIEDVDELEKLFESIDLDEIISRLEDAGVPSDLLDVIEDGDLGVSKEESTLAPFPGYGNDW